MATSKKSPSQDDVKLVQELARLYEQVLEISAKDARTRAEAARQAGTLNKEIKILNNQMHEVVFQSDYLYRTFQEQTSELKNQNNLLKLGKSTFKGLTDIAQDLNHFQRGITDLTEKQLNKMESSLKIEEKELGFIIKRLANNKGEYVNQSKINRLQAIGSENMSKAQKLRLEELQKEKDLLTASQEALKSGIPILEKEYELSKQIYQVNENLGGLAKAAAGTISKYGGDLSRFLKVDDAIESVNEYNKALIDGALKEEGIRKKLIDIDTKRQALQRQLETGRDESGKFISKVKVQKELNNLEQEAFDIKSNAIASVNTLGNKFGSLKILIKGLGEGLKKSLTDPVAILSFIGEALFKGSEGIANFRKELGLTYGQAYELNTQLNFVGNNVFDASINGEKLKKSFIDLSQSMGFVADYGNDALVTMTNLTGKLGLSNQEASQLTTLSRLQSTNTEAVLNNVGKTVSRMNQQGKTSILLKDVMKEVANTSKATAVSLGSNPAKIAEAVVAAKQLGTNLQQIESTADSLLNFESSIESELKAELLTGKQMNLERARAAALANDMKTLSEEIGKNEEVIGAFASGNRLAQQATAEALGMSREQLASMVYQQEAMKIGAEGVRAKYGDQAYEALKAQNAQEKFANAVEKLKSAFSSIVQIFSPLIDGLGAAAEFVANVTSQWYILYPLVGIVALSYIPKIAAGFAGIGNSIAGAAKNFTKLFSKEGRASLFGGGTTTGGGNNAAENLTNQASKNANKVTSTKGGGIGGFLKGIKMNDVLKGAAAILILSAALFVAAKAFQEFANVNWEEIEMAGVALVGLTGVAFILGKLKGPIIEGAIAIAILGAALIPLGYALNLASPGIEAFGKAIKSAFEGIGTIITAAANGISTIFTSLQSVDVAKLLLIGPALIGIGTGLAALGGGGIIGAIGSFLSGDPIKKLEQLAASGDGLQKTATALQAIAGALAGVTTALSTIDVSKLETLNKFSNTQASNSAVNGITNFITAPIKAIGEVIGGGKEEINNSIDLTPMIAAINEVKAAINTFANRPINIMMDSTKVGTGLVQSSYKTP